MIDNEDANPVGSPDPLLVFEDLALRAGLLKPGEAFSTEMLAFATLIVDKCASIADAYGDPDCGGNGGEHIRAELYEH